MAMDVLILNTAVLDLRSPDFTFVDGLVGAGGLAKCPTGDMPDYTQAQLAAYVSNGCATAGGPGNTAPLLARAGLQTAVGVSLGKGEYSGFDIQGRTFYNTLATNEVDLSAVCIHPTLPTGTTFIHEVTGGERGGIAYFPNANNDFDFEAAKQQVRRLSPSVVYYMYSGLSDRGDQNEGKDLAAFVAWCRAQGSVVIVDSHTLAGDPRALIERGEPVSAYTLLAPLLSELDIFFTSSDEARMIRNTLDPAQGMLSTETHACCREFLAFVTKRFANQGRTQLFGVTVKNGAYVQLITPEGQASKPIFYASRFMVDGVVDLVGAGDSFRAGVIAAIAKQMDAFRAGTLDIGEVVQIGNLMATLYVTAPLNDRYGHIQRYDALVSVVREGRTFSNTRDLLTALGV